MNVGSGPPVFCSIHGENSGGQSARVEAPLQIVIVQTLVEKCGTGLARGKRGQSWIRHGGNSSQKGHGAKPRPGLYHYGSFLFSGDFLAELPELKQLQLLDGGRLTAPRFKIIFCKAGAWFCRDRPES